MLQNSTRRKIGLYIGTGRDAQYTTALVGIFFFRKVREAESDLEAAGRHLAHIRTSSSDVDEQFEGEEISLDFAPYYQHIDQPKKACAEAYQSIGRCLALLSGKRSSNNGNPFLWVAYACLVRNDVLPPLDSRCRNGYDQYNRAKAGWNPEGGISSESAKTADLSEENDDSDSQPPVAPDFPEPRCICSLCKEATSPLQDM
jgi:hypothetical protein